MSRFPAFAEAAELWAIACLFNPARYHRRLRNFRAFRKHLVVPLIAVELSFNGKYELNESDAEALVQVSGSDIMWQKERLLNLALHALPPACRFVAWLDADVIFEREDWPVEAMTALARHPLVQPFTLMFQCAPAVEPKGSAPDGTEFLGHGLASRVRAEGARSLFALDQIQAAGFAWAARREILDEHGFYDACVIGGGDRALAAAAFGDLDGPTRAWCWNPNQVRHYRAWAEPFFASVGGDVGCVAGRLYHLWHGEARHRRYRERLLEFAQYDFDPETDIRVDPSGCWGWATEKREMHEYLARYFRSRYEDG